MCECTERMEERKESEKDIQKEKFTEMKTG